MTIKLDIHCVLHPELPGMPNFPYLPYAAVHIVPGVLGNIGLARSRGFSKGSAEYATFVDYDDDLISGQLPKVIAYLDAHPEVSAVFTDEIAYQVGDQQNGSIAPCHPTGFVYDSKSLCSGHHLAVLRRSALTPYIARLPTWPFRCEESLYQVMLADGHVFHHVNELCYLWRMHNRNSFTYNIEPSAETKRILDAAAINNSHGIAEEDWRPATNNLGQRGPVT